MLNKIEIKMLLSRVDLQSLRAATFCLLQERDQFSFPHHVRNDRLSVHVVFVPFFLLLLQCK